MIQVVRELAKVIMFTILWGIPVFLSYINHSNSFLFLLLGSVLSTGFLIGHYESLDNHDNLKNKQHEEM